MLVISATEFRANQKNYLDRIDQGEQILIQRSKNKSYKITPVQANDKLMTLEQFNAKMDQSMQEYQQGEYTKVSTEEELDNLLQSL